MTAVSKLPLRVMAWAEETKDQASMTSAPVQVLTKSSTKQVNLEPFLPDTDFLTVLPHLLVSVFSFPCNGNLLNL